MERRTLQSSGRGRTPEHLPALNQKQGILLLQPAPLPAPKPAMPFSFPRSWVKKQVWSTAAGLTSMTNTFLGSSILWTRAASEAEVRLTSRSVAVDSSARPTHPSDNDRAAQAEPTGVQQLTGCPVLAMAPGSVRLYAPAPPGAHFYGNYLVAFIHSFTHSKDRYCVSLAPVSLPGAEGVMVS